LLFDLIKVHKKAPKKPREYAPAILPHTFHHTPPTGGQPQHAFLLLRAAPPPTNAAAPVGPGDGHPPSSQATVTVVVFGTGQGRSETGGSVADKTALFLLFRCVGRAK
jgi:hypothetical protein